MNANVAVLPHHPKFRTSILAVIAAILLVGALQNIIAASLQILRPAAIHVINLAILRGHFHFYPIVEERITWMLVILNVVIGIVGLCLSYWLAYRNYAQRSRA